MQKNFENLNALVGEEVSAVAFVADYVEFHFNGPILRAIEGPMIRHGGRALRFPEPGSRDMLCAIILFTVESIHLDEKHGCELKISDGTEIVIPLDMDAREGPEAMHYVPQRNGPIQVW
jgi:hypothetical protein